MLKWEAVWENSCRRKLRGNKVSFFVQTSYIVAVVEAKK